MWFITRQCKYITGMQYYIGGKRYFSIIRLNPMVLTVNRNSVRARLKDANGKTQRSHFGKERYRVLSQGLSLVSKGRSDTHNEPQAQRPKASDIGLAHAQADIRAKQPQSTHDADYSPIGELRTRLTSSTSKKPKARSKLGR